MTKYAARLTFDILLTLLFILLLSGCSQYSAFSDIVDGPDKSLLTVSPDSAQLLCSESLSLEISGGVPPYTFSLITALGGSGEELTDQVYKAPDDATGSVLIQVMDSYLATASANIVVVSSSGTLPLSLGPSAISINRGNIVTLEASGGSQSYTYSLKNSIGGTGEALIDNIYNAPTDSDGVAVISVSDGIDTVDAVVTVSMDTVNAGAASDVNYEVDSISNTGSTSSGSALTGEFSFTNIGSESGNETIDWVVYCSLDDIFGSGDRVISSGNINPLNADETSTTEFSGTWPTTVNEIEYYLILKISAGDDLVLSDNTMSVTELITVPEVSDIDYYISSFDSSSYSVNEGESIDCSFIISNQGNETGTKNVSWNVYRSSDTYWDSNDLSLQSGVLPEPFDVSSNSSSINITAEWPEAAGVYYLIIRIFADDDTNTSNNMTYKGPYTISGSGTDVDNYVATISRNYPTISTEELCSETFSITNLGGSEGAGPISWTAYASTDTTLDVGTDNVIGSSGDSPLTSLGPGGIHPSIPISGTWPEDAEDYYLIVEISTDNELPAQESNNTSYNGPYTVLDSPDYIISSLNLPLEGAPGTFFGDSENYYFEITEDSGNTGNQPIHWELFASADPNLSEDDESLMEDNIDALSGWDTTGSISLEDAPWPDLRGDYYLILTVDAEDDGNPVNNSFVSTEAVELVLRYTESVDSTANVYTGSPAADDDDYEEYYSDLDDVLGGSLSLNQLIKITDVQGENAAYDTYGFTAGEGVNIIKIYAQWEEETQAIDLLFRKSSIVSAIDSRDSGFSREPDIDYWVIDDIGNDSERTEQYYVSVNFMSSAVAGEPYDLYILGAP